MVAVTAVRTGCGKSQTSRRIGRILLEHGLRVVLVRHPMSYGLRSAAKRLSSSSTRARSDLAEDLALALLVLLALECPRNLALHRLDECVHVTDERGAAARAIAFGRCGVVKLWT